MNPYNSDLFNIEIFQILNIPVLAFFYFFVFKTTRVSAIASLSTVLITVALLIYINNEISNVVVIGVMPAAAFGLFLPISNLIDESSAILVITALAYIFIASVLYFADKLEEGDKSILDLSLKESLTIGFAQALALFPGVSRSGITLSTALYLKLKKTEAIFFSLLLGLPTIFGAWLLTFMQATEPIDNSLWIPCIAAFLSGLVAIRVLINFTVSSKLNVFSIYCFFMGLISLGTYLINL